NYLFYKYKSCQGRTDIYIAFIENCLPKLNKSGIFSFIIPFAFTNQVYGTLLREQLINNYNINEIVDTSSYYIFNKAKVKNIIINISNKYIKDNSVTIKKYISEVNFIADIKTEFRVNQREFLTLKDFRLETKPFSNLIKLKNKIDNISIKFDQICFIAYGARLNHRTKNIPKSNYVYDKHSKGLKAFFEGKNIDRYLIEQYGWLDYKPGEHYNPMFPELFENEKISFINVVKDRLRFALDRKGMYNSHTVINCVKYDKLLKCTHVSVRKALKEIDIEKCKLYDYSFLLAILNSKLITWYFRSFLSEGLHFYPNDAKMLPIVNIINSVNCENRDNIKLLVNSLEASYYEKSKTSFPTHSEALDHKIAHFEQKINKIVYELYGLTEEEIKIVEGV
ncbi:MAG: hypothetical protein GYA14_10835, partial [Ignavibacteria bacterium]|nr:hypothetical protein [Ignavibacteria bacterium]